MGHFHIQWKTKVRNNKVIQRHANKNSIKNAGHNAKLKCKNTHRQTAKVASTNEMLKVPTKIRNTYRQSIPHQIRGTYTSNNNSDIERKIVI
jgi:hypothetical protein